MEKKFGALRTIGNLYKIFAILILGLTLLGMIASCLLSVAGSANSDLGGGGIFGGIILAGITLLYGGVIALGLYATGEAIFVILGIEENTRATSILLQRQLRATGADKNDSLSLE